MSETGDIVDSTIDNTDKSLETKSEVSARSEEVAESAERTDLKEIYGSEMETKENEDGTIAEDVGFQEETGLSEEQKVELQAETGWSDEIVDSIASQKEADIYKEAGLEECEIDGEKCLIRIDIDLLQRNKEDKLTNTERMEIGLAPYTKDGEKVELHHIGQREDSPLAELTVSEHRCGGNDTILHDKTKETEVHTKEHEKEWKNQREKYWHERSDIIA